MTRSFPALAVAAVVLLLSAAPTFAATGADEARFYLSEGRRLIRQDKLDAAIIQLKNAAQSEPGNGEVRYVLGLAYFKAGDFRGAEESLRAAAERHYNPDLVDVALGDALVKQEKYGAILDELAPGDREADLEGRIRLVRGYAYYGLRRLREAERSFKEAAGLMSNPALSQVGLAQSRLVNSDLAGAGDLLERAVAGDPTILEAWVLLGKVREWQRDVPAALNAFDKAIALSPNNEPARRARLVLLADRDEKAAQDDIDALLGDFPDHPTANTIDAIFKIRHGKWNEAEVAIQSIGELTRFPASLYVLARVNLAQGYIGQADENINRYLTLFPGDANAQGLKARLLLARGNPGGAIERAKLALAGAPNDPQVLATLAEAYMRNGDGAEADAVLKQLSEIKIDDSELRVRLAVRRFEFGQTSEALGDLEQLLGQGAMSVDARSVLVMAYLKRSDLDKAFTTADALRRDAPTSAAPEIALGMVAFRREGAAAARAHFEKALALQPGSIDAQINIAQTYRAEQRPAEARAVLERLLKGDPRNTDAFLALADLAAADRKPDEMIDWLERGRDANAQSRPIRLRLIAAYLQRNETAKAVSVAQELDQFSSGDPQVLAALGEAQLANKEVQSAISTFQKLATATSDSPQASALLARALATANDIQGAGVALRKGLTANPDNLQLQRVTIAFAQRSRTIGSFVAFARELGLKRPADPAIDELIGTLLLNDGRPVEAVNAFNAALAKDQTGAVNRSATLGLVQAQQAAGDPQTSVRILRDWISRNQADRESRVLLARLLGAAGKTDEALAEHEKLVAELPGDPLLLNDLAWLYQVKGDARALATAEEAYRLAPDSPAIADTLGWIVLQRGDNQRAVKLLEQATRPVDATPAMKYRLAVALERIGRRSDAREVLNDALSSGTEFSEVKEARALRAKISN